MLRENITTIIKTVKYMLGIVNKNDKKLYGLYALQFFSEMLLKFKIIIMPKFIFDEITFFAEGEAFKKHIINIIIYVMITIGIELIAKTLLEYTQLSINLYREWFDQQCKIFMADKCMQLDFEHTEDPEVLDQRNKASEGMLRYSGGVVGILSCVYSIAINIVGLVCVVAIIVIYCPLLLPLQVLVLVLSSYLTAKNNKIEIEFYMKLSKINRVFGYVLYQLVDPRYGKDIRLYDSADMIENKEKEYVEETINIFSGMYGNLKGNSIAISVINCLREGISYLYTGILVIKQSITLGDFSMCTQASGEMFQCLSNIAQSIQGMSKSCNYAYEFIVFMNYPDAKVKGKEKVSDGNHVIEFINVDFKYPRSDQYVLKNINIKIKSGEHLSVVGLNGAGKTTFIKLLCRFYDVTSGEILIDGINIQKYSEEEYRKLFAVVFQDFRLFAFSIAENVVLSDNIKTLDQRKAVERCLKLSGMYEDVTTLDNGIDTILYKTFEEGGTELSGGQAQKVAISRALYKDSPIVILDEPTAALDPVAEYEIYNRFNELIGGKTAIYISHRLSSCKFCDNIAVFAENTIKEYGTHDELVVKENGIYAEMFNQQAQYYVSEA